MGLLDFAKNAGHRLGIGKGSDTTQASEAAKKAADRAREQTAADNVAKAANAKVKAAADAVAKAAAEAEAKKAADDAAAAKAAAYAAAAEAQAEFAKSNELEDFVTKLGLNVSKLDIRYNDGCAYVGGECPTEADKEKLILAVGNISEVGMVIDTLAVAAPADSSTYHTVVKGDTLSKIAKHVYGDANKYPVIFEANKPMLKDPDEIFPGQILRCPALT